MLGFRYNTLLIVSILLFGYGCRHKKDAIKTVNKPKSNVVSGSAAFKEKMGLTNKEIKDNKLYSFINDWYGTPYKYGGCEKSGVDCSCFTINLFEKVYNKKMPRTASEIYKETEKIKIEKAQEGDLIFFKINSKSITHVGVYLRDNKFVHASTTRGVLVNSLTETYYQKYFYAAGKLKNK
ncbi:MAG: C40 family peptidase [Bacteroidota bacterium]|nr:C40 family peptidase [Bacteroidota bacterium]MDP3144886.1 C40 family peptidase [Bacteroidota bacterium]